MSEPAHRRRKGAREGGREGGEGGREGREGGRGGREGGTPYVTFVEFWDSVLSIQLLFPLLR